MLKCPCIYTILPPSLPPFLSPPPSHTCTCAHMHTDKHILPYVWILGAVILVGMPVVIFLLHIRNKVSAIRESIVEMAPTRPP